MAVAASVGVAAAEFWPVYQSRAYVVLVAVTCAIGLGIAIVGARFRWPAWALVIATVFAYLIAGVPLAVPGLAAWHVLPTVDGLRELLAATALSWKQLVTIVLPVGSYQSLLVPAFILTLVCTVVAGSLALRARHPQWAMLAPAAMFLAAIALGPVSAPAATELGIGLFVVLLFWLLGLRWYRRRFSMNLIARRSRSSVEAATTGRSTGRGFAGAAVIIAVAVAAGGAAAVALPPPVTRDVVRARVEQPFNPRAYPSPLSGFRNYLQPERADEPMLTVTGLPERGRLRLAALDSYDGIVYSVGSDTTTSASGSFTRLPYRLDQGGVHGEPATIAVTVDGYDGVWVPGTGALERITFGGATAEARTDAFYYNDNSRTGAVLGGLSTGDSYRARSVVPAAVADLSTLRPGAAALPPLGDLPDGLPEALAGYVKPGQAPGQQLQSMIEGLTAEGYVSHGGEGDGPVSRSGHGADRISELFERTPMLGDAEQYAVAAALMARQIGFPARVVVGFDPDAEGSTVTVTGSDISAWIEVQDAKGAWVTVDPNPPLRPVPPASPEDATQVSRPRSVVPPPEQVTAPQKDLSPTAGDEGDPPRLPDPILALLLTVLRVAGWSVLALAVIALPFLMIVLSKKRRRRLRFRAATPLARIQGGWREVADTVADYGVEVPRGATRTEFAETVGGMRPLVLASVVDRASFAPAEPGPHDADEVWRAVRELRRALAGERTRRQRLRALISLRSFGRYAGKA
ncbi:transglutaminase domain-containing protein [Cryobacterium tepidiphilum]|uniref:Transglutaminase domain-containing protein n=1 Tax=Cryobacterium tepidiphilum TaxID=2486026 RepID=A0A3M8LDV4_9MICO|nr:transglutaminase domain-containing protein [Cryobacterium tepidiphilum]